MQLKKKRLYKEWSLVKVLREVKRMVLEASNRPYAIRLAAAIQARTSDPVEQTRILFAHIIFRYTYRFDPDGIELLKRPEVLDKYGFGDCDDFTIHILAVLKVLGIQGQAQVVDYDTDGWDHIYAVAFTSRGRIVLDPVLVLQKGAFNVAGTGWNEEKKPIKLKQTMEIQEQIGSGLKRSLSRQPLMRGRSKQRSFTKSIPKAVHRAVKSQTCNCPPSGRAPGSNPEPGRVSRKEMFLHLLKVDRDKAAIDSSIKSRKLSRANVSEMKALSGAEASETDMFDAFMQSVSENNTEGDFYNAEDLPSLEGLGRARARANGTRGVNGFFDFMKKKKGKKKDKKKDDKKKNIFQKIGARVKKAAKKALNVVKKIAGFPLRRSFELFLKVAPKAALFFLPSFVTNQAMLAKSPSLSKKKKKTDGILRAMVKVLGFNRDYLMNFLRNIIFKKFKKTPNRILADMAAGKELQGLGAIGIILEAVQAVVGLLKKIFPGKVPDVDAKADAINISDFAAVTGAGDPDVMEKMATGGNDPKVLAMNLDSSGAATDVTSIDDVKKAIEEETKGMSTGMIIGIAVAGLVVAGGITAAVVLS